MGLGQYKGAVPEERDRDDQEEQNGKERPTPPLLSRVHARVARPCGARPGHLAPLSPW